MRHTPIEPPLCDHHLHRPVGMRAHPPRSQVLPRVAPVSSVSVARMAASTAIPKNQANRPADAFGTCVLSPLVGALDPLDDANGLHSTPQRTED
jgi:hypothetical protein